MKSFMIMETHRGDQSKVFRTNTINTYGIIHASFNQPKLFIQHRVNGDTFSLHIEKSFKDINVLN